MARARPRRVFPCMTSEGCVWNVCSWLVLERGVTLSLLQGLGWLVTMCYFGPSSLRASFISSSNCNVKLGCHVNLCVTYGAVSDQSATRQYDRSTCSWRLALPWRPYTLQSNFRLFGERLRLFIGRGVSFMVTVSFPYRIHNPSRTQKLIQ